MADFAKLSALQWRIIRGVIDDDAVSPWTEAERVSRSRAVARLVGRGILERVGTLRRWGRWSDAVALVVDDVTLRRVALDASHRDDAYGALDARGVVQALQRRRNRSRRFRPDTTPAESPGRIAAQRGAVAAAVRLLTDRGEPVTAEAVAGILGSSLSSEVIRRHLG